MTLSLHFIAKLAFPLLLAAFSLSYRFTIEDAPRAARLFPDALIWLLVAMCLGQVIRSGLAHWRRTTESDAAIALGVRQFGVLVAMAAYYPSVLALHFAVPSVLFLFCVSLLCGASIRQASTVTLVASACVYLFIQLSGFDLPLF